jgi:hypothetical protein
MAKGRKNRRLIDNEFINYQILINNRILLTI